MWFCNPKHSKALLFNPAGTLHKPARCGAGVHTISQHLLAVDKHVQHAGRQLVRLLEARLIDDQLRVKYNDVRVVAGCQLTPSIKLQVAGRQAGQTMDGLLE